MPATAEGPKTADDIPGHLDWIRDYSDMESGSNTELVIGRTIALWYKGPTRELTPDEIEKHKAGLSRPASTYKMIERAELQLSPDKIIILENVIIDDSYNFEAVAGTARINKNTGGADTVLEIQFTDRVPGSDSTGYPQWSVNGTNLNRGISDHSETMTQLSTKWGEAMALYPQAVLDEKETQSSERADQRQSPEDETRQQLAKLGLTSF